jgi:hypothetical protein
VMERAFGGVRVRKFRWAAVDFETGIHGCLSIY